jgi:hypothetical protein
MSSNKIEQVTTFRTSDGKTFKTIEEAQNHNSPFSFEDLKKALHQNIYLSQKKRLYVVF